MNEQKIQPKKIVLGIPHTGTLYTEVVSSLFNIHSNNAINIQMLKDMNIPTDFEINTFKYYENVIFL